MSGFISAMHDPGGEWAFGDKPGWIVHTEALEHSGKGDYSRFVAMGFRNIVRLNQGYGGLGTIPTSDRYDEFAAKCASFVQQSPGIDWIMIGNEPNHEQEWPRNQKIEPEQYAKCFDLCYTAIRNTGRPVKVMTAAVAPWNQQAGDWLHYYRTMLTNIQKCDGFSLHSYTHGTNPDLIWSDEKNDKGWYWHFRTYLDQLQAIWETNKYPLSLPAFITETDQDETWRDANSGWVQNAFSEINAHNQKSNVRKIHCVALFRWQDNLDKWGIEGKNGVIDDFKAAAQLGYGIESALPPTPVPPPDGSLISPPPDSRILDWDARLTARGCTLQPALMPSDPAPLVRVGRWFNEDEAQGRVNIFVRLLDENGNLAIGVPVTFINGNETKPTERKSDPWLQSKGLPAEYSLDFAMYNTAPAYGIRIEGYSGDVIDGCGLGSIEQPDWNIHTAYYFEWKLSKVPEIIVPPIPPVTPVLPPSSGQAPPGEGPTPPPYGGIETGVVVAPAGLNVRAGPSTNFPILGTLGVGSTVLHDDELEGWLHITEGWVSGEYVGEEVPPPPWLPVAPPFISGRLVHPLPGSVRTQDFYQNPQAYEKFSMPGHDGTDFGGKPLGTPVLCMADGVVIRAAHDAAGYGNFVEVAHDAKGATTLYAHLYEIDVQLGQPVGAGDTLGGLGSTGNSTGVHLHLSARLINRDGSYREDCPMRKGRCDPRTWAILHGLQL